MDIAEINSVLERADGEISHKCQAENNAYAKMIKLHQIYKELWAKKYLEERAKGGLSIKDIEARLEVDEELVKKKHEEVTAEINYRFLREKKDQAVNEFEAAKTLSYNWRKTVDGLQDTVMKKQ